MHTTTAPAALAASPFTYVRVAVEHREWLRETTSTIRGFLERTAANFVRVGQLLADAKAKLPRGQWEEWAGAEMPWSLTQTKRLIQVARAFGRSEATDQIGRFGQSALYVFAAPDCPPAARSHALELAADGQRITHHLAKEIVGEYRRQISVNAKEQRVYERAAKQANATRDDDAGLSAAESHRLAGEAIAELAASSTQVHITTITEDDGEERPLFSVTAYGRGASEPYQCRQGYSLVDVLMVLCGRPRRKVCPGCERNREVTKFAVNVTCADGWNRRCKECETKRLRAHKAEKKAKRAAKVAARTAGGPTAPARTPPASGRAPTGSTG